MASDKDAFNPFKHVKDDRDQFELFETAQHDTPLHGIGLPPHVSKFMVIELISVLLIVWGFVWVGRKIATGQPPRGRLWNFLEWVLLFIRDQVAKPALGEHDYKRFLPYLWSLFLFILMMNLIGMVPFMGSPTANLAVTGALALVSFIVIHFNGFAANHGFLGYMATFIPHIEMPVLPKILISLFLFGIEIMGAFIRAIVLAVRLFANMLAGHTVLAIILSFIRFAVEAGASEGVIWGVTLSSITLVVALSLLELFVACLQAFVFTFLTAIFIGLARHPQH